MSVWFCVPSARFIQEADPVLRLWRQKGYRVAAFRDMGMQPVEADLLVYGTYGGYAKAVNELVRRVMAADPDAAWLVAGNDDVEPDPDAKPQDVAEQLTAHFGGTFGVMQPVGDRYGALVTGEAIVHPWMGREWCRRINGGRGPLIEDFFHYFEDAANAWITKKLGRLLLRTDLRQFHNHYERAGQPVPPHLVKAKAHWRESHDLFEKLKAAGFPGHEPIE